MSLRNYVKVAGAQKGGFFRGFVIHTNLVSLTEIHKQHDGYTRPLHELRTEVQGAKAGMTYFSVSCP